MQPKLTPSPLLAAKVVSKLIADVGLEEFQDVRAGSEIVRGLSSGNKRRLSVALALVKEPKILFLDEPSSGVDSASAVRMMTFLKDIAAEKQIAVICTIHQPPASVFAGFDNTMILSMGRIAYFGKADKLSEYLTKIGNPPMADTNPAEFILDLVNTDFTPVEGVKEILDEWSKGTGEAYGCGNEDKVDGEPLSTIGSEVRRVNEFWCELSVPLFHPAADGSLRSLAARPLQSPAARPLQSPPLMQPSVVASLLPLFSLPE